jgi:trimethylamine-N-oxide reductase (cytochrome c)
LALPSEYGGEYPQAVDAVKFTVPASLERFGQDPERPPLNRYLPSWEGRKTAALYSRYPLQLVSPHPRFAMGVPGQRHRRHRRSRADRRFHTGSRA